MKKLLLLLVTLVPLLVSAAAPSIGPIFPPRATAASIGAVGTNTFQTFTNTLGNAAFANTNKFLSTTGENPLTNNIPVFVQAGAATNVIDLNFATSTNILNGNLTILHATNGLTSFERTHVRYLWAGGANRTLAVPAAWKTNIYSAVPTTITNGTIVLLYIKSIGDTSGTQTNIFVSAETYQ